MQWRRKGIRGNMYVVQADEASEQMLRDFLAVGMSNLAPGVGVMDH
jgi:hypothetical protein